jgi:predicted AAA+ superfamily ATPase
VGLSGVGSATNMMNRENLFKALGDFLEAFRYYVVSLLVNESGDNWAHLFVETLNPAQRRNWEIGLQNGSTPQNLIDFHYLKNFAIRQKHLFQNDFQRNTAKLPTWLEEIADVRHKLAHYDELDDDEVTKAWIHIKTIAKILNMRDLEAELIRLEETPHSHPLPEGEGSLPPSFGGGPGGRLSEGKSTPLPFGEGPGVGSAGSGSLPPWFRVVRPHADICRGRLDESVFAANLAEVALGNGREMYNNPVMFFAKTFVTAGLKNIATRVVRGLNGGQDAENRVISLQTGFGGGKTHTLISLFHLARWGKKASASEYTRDLLAAAGEPEFDSAQIAVFTNTTNDPVQGRSVDGLTIRTLWGELAYQLGGPAAYAIIRDNDEQRVAPKGLFKRVLEQCQPALILIDELADYCIGASAVSVGNSNLSDQTVSFIQELTEAIAGADHCVLIATLPASAQELTSSPVAAQILSALENRITRVGANLKPVEDDEIFEVVRRRLFEDAGSPDAVDAVVSAYMHLYQSLLPEIPSYAVHTEFRNRLKAAYPFHPELIDMFRLRWASNPSFQRTRGVLRILAAIVADLWQRQTSLAGPRYLIQTSDVMLANLDAITSQITMLHGPNWDSVISADVSGASSNAFRIDAEVTELGRCAVTQGLAATILLGTFGAKGHNKGVAIDDLKLCMLTPEGFNHNDVNGALDRLESAAHYLYYSDARQRRYWFDTTPNINILITQAQIEKSDVLADILKRLTESANAVHGFHALVNPSEDIPEQTRPTLVILSPDYAVNPHDLNGKTRALIEKLAAKKGHSDRMYRNTMLFLVCSDMGLGKLSDHVRAYLACQKINREYASQLTVEQKTDLRQRIADADRQAAQALAAAYALVVKYSAKHGLARLIVKHYADSLDRQINTHIIDQLKEEEWLLEAVGLNTLRKNNLLPTPERAVNVKDLYEAFLRFDDKPMLTGPDAIAKSLSRYCYNGEFCIATGDGQHFTKFFFQENVPFFDVNDAAYWLVDNSRKPQPQAATESAADAYEPLLPELDGTRETHRSQTPPKPNGNTADIVRTFKSITVSGNVAVEQYTQLFSSFIMPLAQNRLEIDIRITGRSTEAKPLTTTSQEYKIVKESAKQLGLRLEEEI